MTDRTAPAGASGPPLKGPYDPDAIRQRVEAQGARRKDWRCRLGFHRLVVSWHSGPRLWCNVGYECDRGCGYREERHEDHWTDRHKERGLT